MTINTVNCTHRHSEKEGKEKRREMMIWVPIGAKAKNWSSREASTASRIRVIIQPKTELAS